MTSMKDLIQKSVSIKPTPAAEVPKAVNRPKVVVPTLSDVSVRNEAGAKVVGIKKITSTELKKEAKKQKDPQVAQAMTDLANHAERVAKKKHEVAGVGVKNAESKQSKVIKDSIKNPIPPWEDKNAKSYAKVTETARKSIAKVKDPVTKAKLTKTVDAADKVAKTAIKKLDKKPIVTVSKTIKQANKVIARHVETNKKKAVEKNNVKKTQDSQETKNASKAPASKSGKGPITQGKKVATPGKAISAKPVSVVKKTKK